MCPPTAPLSSARAVDVHVGLEIRRRRRARGLGLRELAEAVGLSHQQVHKYERAASRVSAGALQRIGEALGCPPGAFFPPWRDGAAADAWAFAESAEGPALVRAWRALGPADRRALLRIARALAEP
jgi:transcriptional regulator with XRE-family HTH domain